MIRGWIALLFATHVVSAADFAVRPVIRRPIPPAETMKCQETGLIYYVLKNVIVDGTGLKSVRRGPPLVLELTEDAARRVAEYGRTNVGGRLGILYEGNLVSVQTIGPNYDPRAFRVGVAAGLSSETPRAPK